MCPLVLGDEVRSRAGEAFVANCPSEFFDVGEAPWTVLCFAFDFADVDAGGGLYFHFLEIVVVFPHDGQPFAQGGGIAEEVLPQILGLEGLEVLRFLGVVVDIFLVIDEGAVDVTSDETGGTVGVFALEGDVDTGAIGADCPDGEIRQIPFVVHLRLDDAPLLFVVKIEFYVNGMNFIGVVYDKVTVEDGLCYDFELAGKAFDSG